MADNLEIWNKFADIDPAFTKPITGKPYKGTSPNPHYVIRCLTEMFGPVGKGFGWEVVAEGFQPLGDEVLHWCRIRFWHGDGQGFEAYGQTKALMKTRNGMMLDEDAPKKSLTDAITKAAAQIGVASNIFLGRWDDSRYVAQVNQEFREAENVAAFQPIAYRDRVKGAIERAATLADLGKLWKSEAESLAHLKELDPPKFNELNAAKDARKAALTPPDPAMQAPDGFDPELMQ